MSTGLRHSGITCETIFRDIDPEYRKTKIICTLGPSCATKEALSALIASGMNVARFNFSHGDHKSHKKMLRALRAACKEHPDSHVTIMLDTKGPEIRTGYLENKTPVDLVAQQTLEITTDYTIAGNSSRIACSYADLPRSVRLGGKIFIADGSLTVIVTAISETSIMVRCENDFRLGEKKNMNLPGVSVNLPVLSPQDIADIQQWGLSDNCKLEEEEDDGFDDSEYRGQISIDAIAVSFVCRPGDITAVRDVLGEFKGSVKIIAKIENQEGLHKFDDILKLTDGIMVARGDLGMEIPPERVFLAQKMMIRKCNISGKPVVTATQMLESMIKNARPTRAECADVANAVLDGTDCVMLSGETANGLFPFEAVRMMGRCCCEAELMLNHDSLFNAICASSIKGIASYEDSCQLSEAESIASSAVKTSMDLRAKLIIVLSQSGRTAQFIAKYRPNARVIALTFNGMVARQSNGFHRGVKCLISSNTANTDEVLRQAITYARQQGWVVLNDLVVAVHGGAGGIVVGSTNMLRVIQLREENFSS